jgi:predicted TPR repeat methyltransferase
MTNRLVALGHMALQNQVAYDSYQFCVGGVRYRNKLINELSLDGMTNFVDLGCGTGVISTLLPLDVKYFGIDQSQKYLKKASLRKPDGRFSHSDVCDPKWVDDLNISKSSVVSALGLFHHLSDEQIKLLLSNLKRFLTPEDTIFSVDPTVTSKTSSPARWFANNDRGNFVRPPELLEAILNASGFKTKISVKSKQFRVPLDTIEIYASLN